MCVCLCARGCAGNELRRCMCVYMRTCASACLRVYLCVLVYVCARVRLCVGGKFSICFCVGQRNPVLTIANNFNYYYYHILITSTAEITTMI